MIPIDEQIAYVKCSEGGLWEKTTAEPTVKAILASLQRLKAIDEVQVPEEPVFVTISRQLKDENTRNLITYIDTLRDLLRLETARANAENREVLRLTVERNTAEAKLAAAEENVSELMAEAFDRTHVAGVPAVSAAEDHSPQRVEAPHFKEWANRVYGDVRPCDIDRIEAAFTAGAEAAEAINAAMLKLGEEPSEEMACIGMEAYHSEFGTPITRYMGIFKAMFAKLIEQAGVKK